ncbi:MAG: hypothetical protein FWC57_01200 [Endomicrobia bacterium]|nr:hypothetical protein [Endomicrobiia bacterium]
MKKANRNYHDLLRKLPAVKVAAVVLFAMFTNIALSGVVISRMGGQALPAGAVVELGNELGKIASVVNLPIKIVNDMFKKDREFSGSSEKNNVKDASKFFALLVPVKQAKKSGDILKVDAFMPYGGSGKTFYKTYDRDIPPRMLSRYSCMISYPPGSDAVRFMLLLLLIMLVLPRGIPVLTKNLIYRFCVSRLYLFKDGILFFIGEREIGRVK